jgi:histidinol phosphatase-like enzyme
MNAKLSPAVILDRDGTLHRDTGYLIRFEDFEPLEGVDEALNILKDLGFRLFVATNQSGVARVSSCYQITVSLHRLSDISLPKKEKRITPKDYSLFL